MNGCIRRCGRSMTFSILLQLPAAVSLCMDLLKNSTGNVGWSRVKSYSREGSAAVRDSVESAHHEAYLCMWSLPLCNVCNGMGTSIHGSDVMLTSCI